MCSLKKWKKNWDNFSSKKVTIILGSKLFKRRTNRISLTDLLQQSGTIISKTSTYVESICHSIMAVMGIEALLTGKEKKKKRWNNEAYLTKYYSQWIRLLILVVLLYFCKALTSMNCSESRLWNERKITYSSHKFLKECFAELF